MAKASVTCHCDKCGKDFTHTHNCYNRKEADNYEEWAKWNITICPECYREKTRQKKEVEYKKALDELDKIPLPKIEGVSEKQKNYAAALRERELIQNIPGTKKVIHLIGNINQEKLEAACSEEGKNREEMLLNAMCSMGLGRIYIALYYTNANDIINALK